MAFLSGFLKKGEATALGIDIGSSAIKVVQIKKKNGQAALETYGELSLGPYAGLKVGQAAVLAPDKIAQALLDLMKEQEVNVTTKRCGISIPFSSALMSIIEMPDVSPKQLGAMVSFEARRYIPVPISEVMLDWSIIPKSEVRLDDAPEDAGAPSDSLDEKAKSEKSISKVDVLIVAIHNETIAKYQEIVTKAALDASFFEIEIFSTMRAVLDESLRPVMIVDIGAASSKLYIVERGIIRESHTVNRGSQDVTAAISNSMSLTVEKAEILKRQAGLLGEDPALKEIITLTLDYIFAEANNALLAFEKKHNKAVSKVILVGGGSALKGLTELAKSNLRTEVEVANPFSKLSTPAFLEDVLKETGPEFAVAIGIALRKLGEER